MLLMISWFACLFGGGNIEGDEAGECRDGADDDKDGAFDCDDEDCAGSPDCEETGPTTSTTPTTDDDYPCTVTLVEPKEGGSYDLDDGCSAEVLFEVILENFTLMEPTGQPDAFGEGHLEMCIDAACADVSTTQTTLTGGGLVAGEVVASVSCKKHSGANADAGDEWTDSVTITLLDPSGNCAP